MKKPAIRLYVPQTYSEGEAVTLAAKQAHYAAHVMRVKPDDVVSLFNGKQGEWLASVAGINKKEVTLKLLKQHLPQKPGPNLWLVFAPIKNKTEIVVEKATELGVGKIITVVMRHSVVTSVKQDKLLAHAIEAAEQSERLNVPAIEHMKDIPALLAGWPSDRTLLYGDESGGGMPMVQLLCDLTSSSPPNLPSQAGGGKRGVGLLIGPEGGFSKEEHYVLKNHPCVKAFSMGPRILRADTAAVAALACVQAWLGDWQEKPNFAAGA